MNHEAVNAFQILKNHGLRNTDCRMFVINQFLKVDHALSQTDLQDAPENKYDRVTLYRTINSFEEKGLIHKVIENEGKTFYALCGNNCNEKKHEHNHVHFNCNSCGKSYCLDNEQPVTLGLPKGFEMKTSDIQLFGKCPECS